MRFQMKTGVGAHQSEGFKGTEMNFTAPEQQVIESPHDLCKLFPNKFDRLPDKPVKGDVKTDPRTALQSRVKKEMDPPPVEEMEEETSPEEEEVTPEKKDVTDKFAELAKKADVQVWKQDKAFFVFDSSDLDKALNNEGLKKTKDVKEFIQKYLDGALES